MATAATTKYVFKCQIAHAFSPKKGDVVSGDHQIFTVRSAADCVASGACDRVDDLASVTIDKEDLVKRVAILEKENADLVQLNGVYQKQITELEANLEAATQPLHMVPPTAAPDIVKDAQKESPKTKDFPPKSTTGKPLVGP
jgi:hypothetical protein